MALFRSTDCVNVNGSDDPCYRYTMPSVRVKHEGSNKMKKTILVNLSAISEAIGRPMEPLLQHLGTSLSTAGKVEGKGKSARAYVAGHHSEVELQEQVHAFINSCVLCEHCGNPETTLQVAGTRKRQRATLKCGGCGGSTELDPDRKCVKSMMQHAHHGPVKGHAMAVEPLSAAAVHGLPSDLAENSGKQKTEKMRCSFCGHRTSKAVCSRCHEDVCPTSRRPSQPSASPETAHDKEESPRVVVSRWMRTREAGETFSELASCMIASGHRVGVPLLATLGEEFSREAVETLKFVEGRMQPVDIAKNACAVTVKWVPLIEAALADLGSQDEALFALLSGMRSGVTEQCLSHNTEEEIFVGVLLATQHHAEAIRDAHLMAACERFPHRDVALTKFIAFLREDDSDTRGTDD